MTIKDILDGGTSADELSNPGGVEEIGVTALAAAAEVRHLAHGASETTLCGIDRSAVSTVHPSKARKTDCAVCRKTLREGKVKGAVAKDPMAPPPTAQDALLNMIPEGDGPKLASGMKVEMLDGSVWLVEDVRVSGLDVRCLLGGSEYAKGRQLTIGANSPLRLFDDARYEALLLESKKAAAAAKLPAPKPEGAAKKLKDTPAGEPRAAKWTPTDEEIAEVKRLRNLGLAFIPIEKAMGWPDGHGNRPFRICKGAFDKVAK